MSETKLKPCPFCGHKANMTAIQKKKSNMPWGGMETIEYRIKCVKCRAEMRAKRRTDLYISWNRRANDEQADC